MCGILGTTIKIEKSKFDEALEAISYRGPDSSNVARFDDLYLGHRRLSIIDLSSSGNQPMSDSENNFHIVFNGEIYNFVELREGLIKAGLVFNSKTDTEVILNGYKKYGISFFNKMRGMWAFAIFDSLKNKIVLSRDFFGIKPLYYSFDGGGLSFCSELRPLSKILKFKPDPDDYKTYFPLGYMACEKTGVSGVKQLLPGEVIIFDLTSKKYDKEFLNIYDIEKFDYSSLEEALADSVKAHYVSDVPVSILFSGGIDSTVIAALSKKQGFDPICFSVEMENNNDGKYASKISEKLGLKIEKIIFDKDEFSKSYDYVLNKIDIPISDISILPTYTVFNMVKGKTKVTLSGEGGDELFGGYLRHKFLYNTQIRKRHFLLPKLYKNNIFSIKYLAPIQYRLQKIINKITNDTVSTYALSSMTFYEPKALKSTVDFLSSIKNKYRDFPDSLFFDLSLYLPYMLMLKGDRASMFNSVEGRVPFLDKKLFNYVGYLYKNKKDIFFKKELKNILKKYLPEDLIYRKKQGFGVSSKVFGDKFRADFTEALTFHKEREEFFGKIPFDNSGGDEWYNIIIDKYPRFAFGLVSSFYVWKSYGL